MSRPCVREGAERSEAEGLCGAIPYIMELPPVTIQQASAAMVNAPV